MFKKIAQKVKVPLRWMHRQLWYHYHGMYMGYKPLTKENREFNIIYHRLLQEEETLKSQITRYGTGMPEAKLSHIDDTVKRIKCLLKETRELALEYRKEKEQQDEDGIS